MDFTNIKRVIYKISFIVPIALITIAYFAKIIHFNYSDDEMMNNIARGFFDGKQDEHLIFINTTFGYVTKFLYGITKNFNWFAILYIITILISVYALLFVLKKYMRFAKAYCIIIFLEIFNACWFTFTVIAYTSAVVGIILLIDFVNEKKCDKKNIIKVLLIIFLVSSSYSLRRDACISTVLMFIPALVFTLLKKEKIKRLVVFCVLISIVITALFLVNQSAYHSRFWKHYTRFNSARSEVIDYPVNAYEDTDFYKSINYSKNDLDCATGWCFGDETVFNTNTFNKIVENTSFTTRYNINPLTYPETLKARVINNSTYIMVILFVLALIITGVILTILGKRKTIYLTQMIFGLGLIAVTFILNKPVARVVMPLAMIDVVFLLFLYGFNREQVDNLKIKKILFVGEITLFSILSILFAYKTIDKANEFKNDYVSRQKPIMQYVNRHKDSLFLCRGKLNWLYYKPAVDICGDNTCMNIMQTGDQDIYNNCYYNQLKALKTQKKYYNHLLKNLLFRKNTYLLVDEEKEFGTYGLVDKFLKEHVSKNIRSKIIKSYYNKTINIYKFYIE